MTGPSRDLFHLLSYIDALATRRLASAWQAEGCSIEQWRVLALLADGRGHTMTELADFALLPAPTATKLADRMVADNLVYRRPDPADRRRVLVYLTERGRELHTRLAASLTRVQAELMEAVGGADFREGLRRLAEALDPAVVGAAVSGATAAQAAVAGATVAGATVAGATVAQATVAGATVAQATVTGAAVAGHVGGSR